MGGNCGMLSTNPECSMCRTMGGADTAKRGCFKPWRKWQQKKLQYAKINSGKYKMGGQTSSPAPRTKSKKKTTKTQSQTTSSLPPKQKYTKKQGLAEKKI